MKVTVNTTISKDEKFYNVTVKTEEGETVRFRRPKYEIQAIQDIISLLYGRKYKNVQEITVGDRNDARLESWTKRIKEDQQVANYNVTIQAIYDAEVFVKAVDATDAQAQGNIYLEEMEIETPQNIKVSATDVNPRYVDHVEDEDYIFVASLKCVYSLGDILANSPQAASKIADDLIRQFTIQCGDDALVELRKTDITSCVLNTELLNMCNDIFLPSEQMDQDLIDIFSKLPSKLARPLSGVKTSFYVLLNIISDPIFNDDVEALELKPEELHRPEILKKLPGVSIKNAIMYDSVVTFDLPLNKAIALSQKITPGDFAIVPQGNYYLTCNKDYQITCQSALEFSPSIPDYKWNSYLATLNPDYINKWGIDKTKVRTYVIDGSWWLKLGNAASVMKVTDILENLASFPDAPLVNLAIALLVDSGSSSEGKPIPAYTSVRART